MIVITGPSGNVGSEITKLLISRQDLPFRAIARNENTLRQRFGDTVPFARFDYGDRSTWDNALDGISFLFLVLPTPSPQVIEKQIKPFVHAAIAAGCRHIAYISVPAAADNKQVPHHTTETFIRSTGTPYTFLRAGYFLQNFTRSAPTHVKDIRERDQLYVPLGNVPHCLIDTRDIALAAVNIMADPDHHANKAYNVVAEARTMQEVAEVLSKTLGRKIEYPNPRMLPFIVTMLRRGVGIRYVIAMAFVYNMLRNDNSGEVGEDLPRLLGRAPLTTEDFARDYRAAWEKSE